MVENSILRLKPFKLYCVENYAVSILQFFAVFPPEKSYEKFYFAVLYRNFCVFFSQFVN